MSDNTIYDHAFHHQLDDYSASECQTCGKPESHHQWTTTFGKPVVEGTFHCPICDATSPHEHTSEEVAEFQTQATKRKETEFWQNQRERERQLPNALIERMIEIYDHRGPQETKFEAMQRCAMLATAPRKEPQHGAE